MTRQQSITIEQVVCKMEEAKQRATKSMQAALDASTSEYYNVHLRSACKAANDLDVWKRVYLSLIG